MLDVPVKGNKIPQSHKETLKMTNFDEWQKAMNFEINSLN